MSETQTANPHLALHRLILERLAIGPKVGFRYRTLEPFGTEALKRALSQGILRETRRAETVANPDPNSSAMNKLEVRHCADGIFAVSAEGDVWVPPVRLAEEDIRQFELVLPKLFLRICLDNHIDQSIRENEHEIVYLGEREVAGYGRLMIFMLYNNTDELRFLERCRRVSGERWTVALTPIPVSLALPSQNQIVSWRLLLVPMSVHLAGERWALPWNRISASQSGQGVGVQPVADQVFEHLPGLECSHDFRTVRLRGETFNLTPMMAQLFKAMVEMSMSGPRDLAKDAILERGESRSKTLSDVFSSLKNWRNLIVPGQQRGTYRINIPPEP